MKNSNVENHEFRWFQPDWNKFEFELRSGENVWGTLHWEKEFGSTAIAQSADGVWTFKHSGLTRPCITVRAEGKDWDVAKFPISSSGNGWLTFYDGRKLRWGYTDLQLTEWKWDWDDNTPLISIKTEYGHEKCEGVIKIHPQAESMIEASMLTLLGCYTIVLIWQDKLAEALAS